MSDEKKLNSSFQVIGGFWKPDDPKKIIPGILTCKKGSIAFQEAPEYQHMDIEGLNNAFRTELMEPQMKTISALCGDTREGPCSLYSLHSAGNLGLTNFPKQFVLNGQQWQATSAVMGLHISSIQSPVVSGSAFYFTKIHDLFPLAVGYEWGEEEIMYRTSAKARNVYFFNSSSLKSEITCELFSISRSSKTETRLRSVTRIKVTPQTPQTIEWFRGLAFRIENFFALLMGTSVSLKMLQLFKNEEQGWLIQKIRRRKEKVARQLWVKCTHDRAAVLLDNWLSIPEALLPVEGALLGTIRKNEVPEETEFLILTQALEGIARITFPNVKDMSSFPKLLKQGYALLSADFAFKILGVQEDFIKKVSKTRDYFTHIGISKNDFVIDEHKDLFLLNQRLRAFLRCLLLLQIGVLESEMKEAIQHQATRWTVLE